MKIEGEHIPQDPGLMDALRVDSGPACVGWIFDGCLVFMEYPDESSDTADM